MVKMKNNGFIGKVKKIKLCLIFKKSLQSWDFSKHDIIFKCIHLFSFLKLLVSNLYMVLPETNINPTAEWQLAGETSIVTITSIFLYAPLLTREDSIPLRRTSSL